MIVIESKRKRRLLNISPIFKFIAHPVNSLHIARVRRVRQTKDQHHARDERHDDGKRGAALGL